MSFETILYSVEGQIATVTLNRPERLNTIVPPMPDEFEAAIRTATLDEGVKVIVVRGAGRSFCAGYDFGGGFHHWDEHITTDGRWDPGKDFILSSAYGPTQKFMAMWRTPKPVIAQLHGWCVGGGSDMALCADLVIAAEDAQIGTPYSRIWGCYLSGMWVYRLGLAKAKEHALTGKPLSGRRAGECAAGPPRSRRIEFDRDDLTARADQPRKQRSVVAGAGADLEHALSRAEVKLLEHRGHHRWLGRGARRNPTLVLGGDDRLIRVDALEPLALGDLGQEALARLGEEGPPYGGALQRPVCAELLDELSPEPLACA